MEFFAVTNSCAAPFFSDMDTRFVEADSPADALAKVCAEYTHPAGLFSAAIYRDANAREKREPALTTYLSERAKQQEQTV